jgi:magnesium-transporting ATPase (P-type)
MQAIKIISISKGNPVIFLPLSFILCISALKDVFEDLKRHRSDKEENTRRTLVARNGRFESVEWQDLRVGEIVKVKQMIEARKVTYLVDID